MVRSVEKCDESESGAERMGENEGNGRGRVVLWEAASVLIIAEEYQRRQE